MSKRKQETESGNASKKAKSFPQVHVVMWEDRDRCDTVVEFKGAYNR